jgi:hypothetical protein
MLVNDVIPWLRFDLVQTCQRPRRMCRVPLGCTRDFGSLVWFRAVIRFQGLVVIRTFVRHPRAACIIVPPRPLDRLPTLIKAPLSSLSLLLPATVGDSTSDLARVRRLLHHTSAPYCTPEPTTTMHDPFPISRPEVLVKYVEPIADFLSLKTLSLHFHEVIAAFTLYHVTYRYISPVLSRLFFPRIYSSLNARTKLNWDVHVVSFVQSTLVCTLALWVIWTDKELNQMDNQERVHGYTGASGLVQAFAGGYFLWDLMITARNFKIFGIGMLFHAISALCVFSLGFVSASQPSLGVHGQLGVLIS